jgi:hypothetical protein
VAEPVTTGPADAPQIDPAVYDPYLYAWDTQQYMWV